MVIFIFYFFTLVALADVVLCLREIKLTVPAAVRRGDPMWVNCTYDLENDDLYSIKWYKNNVEFYRFLPNDEPPGQKYNLNGIHIDMNKTYLGLIYLSETDLNSEGSYRCEVSAEAPSFQTVRDEKEVRVYVLPESDPIILDARQRYQVGDAVNVTCEAAPSRPPAILQWEINDKEVEPRFLTRSSALMNADGLLSSRLRLQFMVEPAHFWEGIMKLKCKALATKAYAVSRSEIIATSRTKVGKGLNSGNTHDGPIIEGGRPRYEVGKVADVNCTAKKADPPGELQWYINDKQVREDFLRRYPSLTFPDGQEMTKLGLRFTVKEKHFQRSEMKLKCTCTLSEVVDVRFDEIIVNNRQQSSGLHVSGNTGVTVFFRRATLTDGLLSGLVITIAMCLR